jgi:hypothetical protein
MADFADPVQRFQASIGEPFERLARHFEKLGLNEEAFYVAGRYWSCAIRYGVPWDRLARHYRGLRRRLRVFKSAAVDETSWDAALLVGAVARSEHSWHDDYLPTAVAILGSLSADLKTKLLEAWNASSANAFEAATFKIGDELLARGDPRSAAHVLAASLPPNFHHERMASLSHIVRLLPPRTSRKITDSVLLSLNKQIREAIRAAVYIDDYWTAADLVVLMSTFQPKIGHRLPD